MNKEKAFKIIKKTILHGLGLGCTLAAVLLALFFVKYKFVDAATAKSEKYYINDVYDRPIVQLEQGEEFTQEFEAHGDIYGVQIRWHNLAVVQNGTALIQLKGADGDVLAQTEYDLRRIENDVYNEIAFDSPYLNDEEGYQPYTLCITPTFDSPEDSYLKIWGDYESNTIAFGVLKYIVNSANLYGWYGVLQKLAIAAAVVMYLVCFILPIKKHWAFLAVLLAASCLYTMVLPPYSSPDEEGHFNSAYRMVNRWDGYGDKDFEYRTFYKRGSDKSKVFEEKYTTPLTYDYIYENFGEKCTDSEFAAFPESWLVTDFKGVYFVGALAIKLSHILGLGYVGMMYLGRLFNLLFFGICTFFAIKITPVGKEIFMTLALLPITLHLSNSFSRDVFVFSMGFLFTAYLLYLMAQKESYKWWQLGILAVICVLLAPSKFIYAAMCLAVLLLDAKKVPLLNRIKWPLKIHPLVIAAVGAAVLLPVMVKIYLGKDPEFIWRIFPMAPLEVLLEVRPQEPFSPVLMLQNPVYSLKLILNTLYCNGAYYIKSLVGGVLGYNNVIISDAFIIIMLIIMFVSVLSSVNDSYTLKKHEKITFGGIVLIVFGLVLFTCLSWTFVSMDTLYGLQGKYLLPVMPMLLIALKSKTIIAKRDLFRPMCFAMGFTDIFVALNALTVILQR